MSILKTIFEHKKTEVSLKKSLISIDALKDFPLYRRQTLSMTERLNQAAFGIIAEFKRRSPSKAIINNKAKINEVAGAYEIAGASAMSVLTDGTFFGGSLDDLIFARSSCDLPLLRKDFIYHPYQLHEARAYGADVILLIAAMLDASEVESLTALAHELEMEVLLEVHDLDELKRNQHINVDMIGVNNRNLKTFEVNLDTSRELSQHMPSSVVRIAESGIHSPDDIRDLSTYDYKGFLIGESFMKTDNPGQTLSRFINDLRDEN